MKRAFTLPELMLVLAVAGILLGIAVPSLVRATDQLRVEAAARHIVAAHQRARLMAITGSQVLTLAVDSAAISIAPRVGGPPLWSTTGPAESGVTLVGSIRRFTFSPVGFTLGLSNASLQLERGSTTRTVIVSRLGRVRIVR